VGIGQKTWRSAWILYEVIREVSMLSLVSKLQSEEGVMYSYVSRSIRLAVSGSRWIKMELNYAEIQKRPISSPPTMVPPRLEIEVSVDASLDLPL
jgi:hypothetical protein